MTAASCLQVQLADALDELDVVFVPYEEIPVAVGGCTRCFGEADLAALAVGPMDVVPEGEVVSAAYKEVGHWDDFPGLYRRLAPRVVRLLVAGRLDHALVGSRLRTAEWGAWPEPQRVALERVWDAWWPATLDTHPGPAHVTDVLETLAVSAGTLTPWLNVWTATRTAPADLHLSDAVTRWLHWDELADLHWGFYDELPATPELLPWLSTLEPGRLSDAHVRGVRRIAAGEPHPCATP